MPAYFDTGFSVRQPMWHGLGNVLEEAPESWDEARLAAGLLWEPAEQPVYRLATFCTDDVPANAVPAGDGRYFVPVVGHKLMTRDDTGAELAVVRAELPTIDHGTMGDVLDALATEAGNGFKFETAGSIQGGRKVWALAYLDEPFTIPGDTGPTYPFFAVQNAHDGEGAFRVIPTKVRIVCWNTWQAASAEAERHGWSVTIRHAGNVAERIEEAKQAVHRVRDSVNAYVDEMTMLAGLRYDDACLAMFVERFIPTPENATDKLIAARDEKRATLRNMLTQSPTLADLPDTGYKLAQAAGEYLDHVRGVRSPDMYLRRTMFGEGKGRVVKSAVVAELPDILAPAN